MFEFSLQLESCFLCALTMLIKGPYLSFPLHLQLQSYSPIFLLILCIYMLVNKMCAEMLSPKGVFQMLSAPVMGLRVIRYAYVGRRVDHDLISGYKNIYHLEQK